jgi:integrase
MQQTTEINAFCEMAQDAEVCRYFMLELIRQNIKDYSIRDRLIFELSYFLPIGSEELVNLNKSDIDFERRTIRIKRGNITFNIPLTMQCVPLLEKLCSSVSESDIPLFLNKKCERISLSELWFIKCSGLRSLAKTPNHRQLRLTTRLGLTSMATVHDDLSYCQ